MCNRLQTFSIHRNHMILRHRSGIRRRTQTIIRMPCVSTSQGLRLEQRDMQDTSSPMLTTERRTFCTQWRSKTSRLQKHSTLEQIQRYTVKALVFDHLVTLAVAESVHKNTNVYMEVWMPGRCHIDTLFSTATKFAVQ